MRRIGGIEQQMMGMGGGMNLPNINFNFGGGMGVNYGGPHHGDDDDDDFSGDDMDDDFDGGPRHNPAELKMQLPTFKFEKAKFASCSEENKDKIECRICMMDFEEADELRQL